MEVVTRNASQAHLKWFNHFTNPVTSNPSLEVAPRGMRTREFIGSLTVMNHPHEVVPFVFGRKLNYFGMLMESMWILSRVEDVDLLAVWNGELERFSDPAFEPRMYGAYGPRLFNSGTAENGMSQIEAVLELMGDDEFSRRGVATIYQPRDAGHPTNDLPCNTQVMFKLRDNCLNVSVINRSNDLHLGLFGVNSPQFYFLGTYVARWLRQILGNDAYVDEQRHYSDSLHVYLDQEPQKSINDRMLAHLKTFDFYEYFRAPLAPAIVPDGTNPTKTDYVQNCLRYVSMGGRGVFETKNIYEATIWALLQFYAEYKKTLVNDRDKAIRSLKEYIARWHASCMADEDEIPLDWIAGAYYSLVAWGGWNKREARADEAVMQFTDFVKEHCGNVYAPLLSKDFEKSYFDFLLNG